MRIHPETTFPLILAQVLALAISHQAVWAGTDFLVSGPDASAVSQLLDKLPDGARENLEVRADFTALFVGYPGFCVGIHVDDDSRLFLIMSNRARIIYDDGREKSPEEKLADPDLQDTMEQLYRAGPVIEEPANGHDPGSFRVTDFFRAVYGQSKKEVASHLVQVDFAGHKVSFSSRNGAAEALTAVGAEIAELLTREPGLAKYVHPLAGTFAWRQVAGTGRLSPHSFATAIDLNPKYGAYWRWEKSGGNTLAMRRNYPGKIVAAFERHGFVWGGKWQHFDLMHFEYRPELLMKSKSDDKGKE